MASLFPPNASTIGCRFKSNRGVDVNGYTSFVAYGNSPTRKPFFAVESVNDFGTVPCCNENGCPLTFAK
ncbi:MAG: hypothetical protein BWY82_02956 [Verrucomicrobia bacterium ADurb.Bin474]|nr:MAG: hypothetical protein BWY82_02956 [Verrucomicrobia bacterium ADurb.Bin474]